MQCEPLILCSSIVSGIYDLPIYGRCLYNVYWAFVFWIQTYLYVNENMIVVACNRVLFLN